MEFGEDNTWAEKVGHAQIHLGTTVANKRVMCDTEFQEFQHEEQIIKTIFK